MSTIERARDLPDAQGGTSGARAVLEGAGRLLGAGFTVATDYLVFPIVTLFLAAYPER